MAKQKRIDILVGSAVRSHEDVNVMYKKIKEWASEQGYHLFKVFRTMFSDFIEKHIDGGQDDKDQFEV